MEAVKCSEAMAASIAELAAAAKRSRVDELTREKVRDKRRDGVPQGSLRARMLATAGATRILGGRIL